MSVHSTGPVWNNTSASGNDMVVLLALADMANDGEGFAYCRVSPRKDDKPDALTLSRKARLSKSACYERIYSLIATGELRMFRRGHYRSPAFAILCVDTPLDDEGIARRLAELDEHADWDEVTIDGDQVVAVPFLHQRSSGIRTISQNDSVVSSSGNGEAADLDVHPVNGRENPHSRPPSEIVRNQDDPPEIVRNPDLEVLPAGTGSPASRKIKEPSLEPSLEPTTTATLVVDEPGGGGEGFEAKCERIARRWCQISGKAFLRGIPHEYVRQVARFLEDHPEPDDAFLRLAHSEGIKHPAGWAWLNGSAPQSAAEIPDCASCANHRLRGVLPNGDLTGYDDPAADQLTPCPTCRASSS